MSFRIDWLTRHVVTLLLTTFLIWVQALSMEYILWGWEIRLLIKLSFFLVLGGQVSDWDVRDKRSLTWHQNKEEMEILDSRQSRYCLPLRQEAYFKANPHRHEPGGCVSDHCVYLCIPYVAGRGFIIYWQNSWPIPYLSWGMKIFLRMEPTKITNISVLFSIFYSYASYLILSNQKYWTIWVRTWSHRSIHKHNAMTFTFSDRAGKPTTVSKPKHIR